MSYFQKSGHRRTCSYEKGKSRTGTPDATTPECLHSEGASLSQPKRARRKRIPDRPNFSLNLWSIMKTCIGKELSKIPMPVSETFNLVGATCSSVVRAFAHGKNGRRIDPSWGGSIELFLVPASAPRLVSCLWDGAYKRTLAVNQKEKPTWRQRVTFFTIRMVHNHMSDAI